MHDVVVIYSLRTLLQPEEVLLVSQETVQERVHHIRLGGGGEGRGGREGGRGGGGGEGGEGEGGERLM